MSNVICNRLYGGSVRDCRRCRLPDRWLECPPEARGVLVPASVAAAVAVQERTIANAAVAGSIGAPVPPIEAFKPTMGFADDPPPSGPQLTKEQRYELARAKGFTGDICDHYGSPNMTRNGTCVKCNDCGETSGCS